MKESWDECSVEVQAKVLAFHQCAMHDDAEREAQMFGAGKPSATSSKDDGPRPPQQKRPLSKKAQATKKRLGKRK